jgi:hypothetical protein
MLACWTNMPSYATHACEQLVELRTHARSKKLWSFASLALGRHPKPANDDHLKTEQRV